MQRVQQWRKAKIKPPALQDPLIGQPADNNDNTGHFVTTALQDLLIGQPAVLIGLIAHLTGLALQDDIAMAAWRMQQLGNDILNPHLKGGSHGPKTSHLSRTNPKGSHQLQLARPPAGPGPPH